MPATIENPDATAIRPFTIPEVSEAELAALRGRITATYWPDQETVTDDSQGVPLAMVQELATLRGPHTASGSRTPGRSLPIRPSVDGNQSSEVEAYVRRN